MSRIFVFGSNLAGIHGAGAALHAKRVYGAIQGVGEGPTGNAYAIPTKDSNLFTRSLQDIEESVNKFLAYSVAHIGQKEFVITQIGCGLAGYKAHQIAPMFNIPASARVNLLFDVAWSAWLTPGPTRFWDGSL